MYRQITYRTNGEVSERNISEQRLNEMLVQLHFLKQSGEEIEVHTNADVSNGWSWTAITVYRHMKKGTVKTVFERI